MKLRIYSVILGVLLTIPFVASAFTLQDSTFAGIISYLLEMVNILIPIFSGLALLFFFWGLSKFILSSSANSADRKKGKDYMIWGVLSLFILLSFRTIISLVTNEFELGNGSSVPVLPTESAD